MTPLTHQEVDCLSAAVMATVLDMDGGTEGEVTRVPSVSEPGF